MGFTPTRRVHSIPDGFCPVSLIVSLAGLLVWPHMFQCIPSPPGTLRLPNVTQSESTSLRSRSTDFCRNAETGSVTATGPRRGTPSLSCTVDRRVDAEANLGHRAAPQGSPHQAHPMLFCSRSSRGACQKGGSGMPCPGISPGSLIIRSSKGRFQAASLHQCSSAGVALSL